MVQTVRQAGERAGDLREDFVAWARGQARSLRAGRFADLDIEALAEEVEDLGQRHRDALESRLAVLFLHLLKWEFQPAARSASWSGSIREQRKEIAILLRKHPSLRATLNETIDDAYERAVVRTERDTGLPESALPPAVPYSVADLLDGAFFPGATNG